MADPIVQDDLYALGERCFDAYRRELSRYGIPVSDAMELRRGKGMLCYFNATDGHIYLSLPDLSTPMGRLNLLVLKAYLCAESEAETLRFFRLFIPRLIAHEMAHHLRHKHGRMTKNYWEEEQLANQLAVAITRHRMTPDERAFARKFLKRALEGLSKKVAIKDAATLSYYNLLEALNASGQVGDSTVEQIEVVQKMFSVPLEDLIEESPELVKERDEVIAQINSEYATDYVKYMYFHAGWLYVDLTSHAAEYVEEFARVHLGVETPLLAAPEAIVSPDERAVLACFSAAKELRGPHDAVARFFYKRYRMLLWSMVQGAPLPAAAHAVLSKQERPFFLESWSDDDSDALGHLARLVPPELKRLFPRGIGAFALPRDQIADALPTETDRRLFRHVALGDPDPTAEATRGRLALLDETDVFRPVPAETMLELARSLCRVHLREGETVIWEGEVNDDVFFLLKGKVVVLVGAGDDERVVGTVKPGEVFGEMAFFSRDTRNATARAVVPSECFVIKDSDLLLMVYKHPSILMQMAGALTRRLAGVNRHAATGESPHSVRVAPTHA